MTVGGGFDDSMKALCNSLGATLRAPLVVRAGSRGAWVRTPGGEVIHVEGYPTKATHTRSAGSCHTGAMCALIARGWSLVDAVKIANAAASLGIQRSINGVPDCPAMTRSSPSSRKTRLRPRPRSSHSSQRRPADMDCCATLSFVCVLKCATVVRLRRALKDVWGASHYRRVPHQRQWVALGASLCDNDSMVTNSTIETLLNRRSIRKFVAEPFDDDTVATLETVAQHAASSQYLNDWSAVRVKDPALKKRMSEIGRQPYIAEAPLLYVFVADEHRNAIIAESKGVSTDSDTYGLAGSYRFSQAQNDAVLALHAMETAAYSLGWDASSSVPCSMMFPV